MILLVTFIVAGKDIFSENNAKIIVNKSINLCKDDNTRFTFSVNIGEVKTTDSLYGFDIEIEYDPTKIRIINVLTGNTLSETFKEVGFSFGYEENKIKGYATTMEVNIVPPSGKIDLIAFFAEWIGHTDCTDSTLFKITRLEFTDEFKKKISNYGNANAYINAIAGDKDIIAVSTEKKQYNIKSGETLLKINYKIDLPQTSKTNTIKLKFDDSEILEIQSANNLDKNSTIKNIGKDNIEIEYTELNKSTNIEIIFNYLLKDTITNYKYGLKSIEYSECSCINGFTASEIEITKDSLFTSIRDNKEIEYDCRNHTIIINSKNIQNIKFVDILGREVGYYENGMPTTINLNNISTNMIFGLIKVNNQYEIKRFYKCY